MDILKKEKDILDLFSIAILEEGTELELIFGDSERNNPIDKTIFLRLIDKLKQVYHFIGESSNLDIKCKQDTYISPVRCTIKDIDSIKKYCATNSLDGIDNLDFVKKTNYKKMPNTQIKDHDYNLRVNLKVEEDLKYSREQISKYNGVHDTKQKHYRFKKRYSFETPDTLFRIDLTAVKSTQYDNKSKSYKLANTFKEANILNNRETYELEIEFIGQDNSFSDYHDFRTVETMGYSRILKYYNKLSRDIKYPVQKSVNHIHDPLSTMSESVWKPGYEPVSQESTFMESVIVDVPEQLSLLKDKLMGKEVKVTGEFKHDLDLTDKTFIVIDYDDDYDKEGKHVHIQLNKSSSEKDKLLDKLNRLFPDTSLEDMEIMADAQPLKKKQYITIMKKLKPLLDIDVWVPVIYIYSDHFDMDELILNVFQTEMMGGGKLPAWAKKKSSSSSSAYDPRSNSSDLDKYIAKPVSDNSETLLDRGNADILAPQCIDLLNGHIHTCYGIINNYKQKKSKII